jgi:hypothetical protein
VGERGEFSSSSSLFCRTEGKWGRGGSSALAVLSSVEQKVSGGRGGSSVLAVLSSVEEKESGGGEGGGRL